MAAKRVSLGRGLGALIKEIPAGSEDGKATEEVTRIPIGLIRKNPWQPRRHFKPEALEDLVHSIRVRGVLQPLLVRKVEDHYELIAGERRLRAAQEAELKEVPVVEMEADDREVLELALVENLQREDLNPIEEAEGYHALMEQFSMTQEQVAERVGKGRTTVANALRMLALPDSVRQLIAENRLSTGHAKVLLGLEIPKELALLAQRTVREELSVRTLEKIVNRIKQPPKKARVKQSDIPDNHIRHLSERLHQHLGTSVRVRSCKTLANGKKVKGCVEIDYYSSEDLDRVLTLLGLTEEL